MLHPQVSTGLLSLRDGFSPVSAVASGTGGTPGQPHPAVPVALLCVLLRVLIADEEIAWLDPSLTPSL